MAYYNPYVEFSKVKDYNFNIDNQAIMDRFNARLAQETAARRQALQPRANEGPTAAGAVVGALGQIGGALANQSANPYEFQNFGAAPFTGAAQGFATGGPVGALAGGIAGLTQGVTGFFRQKRAIKKIDPSVNLMDVDPTTGRPTFSGAAAIEAGSKVSALRRGARKKRGLFGNRYLANKMDDKADDVLGGLQAGRDQFNTAATQFNAQQLAQTQYNQLINNQNRLRNLYSIGTSLY